MVQLAEDLVARLDQEATSRGMSRSALIREILGRHLDENSKASVGRRIAEGYKRIPPITPDAWGNLVEFSDQATADLLTRLDAEEHAAGAPPW